MKVLKNWKQKAAYGFGRLQSRLYGLFKDESGVGTVEVVLLILVAVGLVLIFKDRITQLVTTIFGKIASQAGKV